MSSNSDIPCSNCKQWNEKKKSFLCNPDKCASLSEWLLDHAALGKIEDENIMVIAPEPIQYVV
jgi:hypothetical protein